MSLHLFAGLRVRDFQAARPWYERLLGEPTFFPHASEAVWTLAEDRSVYVEVAQPPVRADPAQLAFDELLEISRHRGTLFLPPMSTSRPLWKQMTTLKQELGAVRGRCEAEPR
jgi:hypothetical protein